MSRIDAIRVDAIVESVALVTDVGRVSNPHPPRITAKRVVDIVASLVAMPFIALAAVMLLAANPFLNPGPLFFRQRRMGQGGRPFLMLKFRTMAVGPSQLRAFDAPVEIDRITPLGAVLRKYRIDELPNFVNVLRGEMSLVGPRPDAVDHAWIYARTIPWYGERYRQKPGVTGLAQVRSGYADSLRAVQRKARYDQFYVRRASFGLDIAILLRTVRVVVSGFGAK